MGAVVDCKLYVKSRSLILGQKEGNVSDSLQLKLIILGLSNDKECHACKFIAFKE